MSMKLSFKKFINILIIALQRDYATNISQKMYFLKWVSTYSFISKLNSLTTFDFNMFEFHFLFLKKSKMFSEQTANQLYQRNRGSDTRKVSPMIRLFPSRWWLFCRSYRMRLDSQTWGGPKQAAKQGHHVCQQVH